MIKPLPELLALYIHQAKTHSVKPLTKAQRAHDATVMHVAERVSYALTQADPQFNSKKFIESIL